MYRLSLSYELGSMIPKRRSSGREGSLQGSESHLVAEAVAPFVGTLMRTLPDREVVLVSGVWLSQHFGLAPI